MATFNVNHPTTDPKTPLTGYKGLKRNQPESPDDLSPNIKQIERQIKFRQDNGDHESFQPSVSSQNTSDAATIQLSELVLSVINSPQISELLIPKIVSQVVETLQSTIEQIVDDKIRPYVDTLKANQELIEKQAKIIKDQTHDISLLNSQIRDKNMELENRIEEQEQYSRRTSLRFNNVPVPSDVDGNVIQPIDSDKLVLDICAQKLNLADITIDDIGRSHPIGEIRDGKCSIIVRFLSYRKRASVYRSKRKLKNNADKIFITENLTKTRYGYVKKLNDLRNAGKIHTFWTQDGTIMYKRTENSKIEKIRSNRDVLDLADL